MTRPAARTRLVETADRLFYAEGIRAVGIDRVVAEAGVAKATLYAHFPSKNDLLLAVLAHREAAVSAFLADAVARHRRSLDPLRAFFAALDDWFRSPGFRGCAFQNTAVEVADPTHPAAAFARGQKARFRAFVGGLVLEACGPAAAPHLPAVAVLVEGAVVTALVEGTPDAAATARDAALSLLGRQDS